MTEEAALQPQSRIVLRPINGMHRGEFLSLIREITPEGLRISMPTSDGQFVLMPAGTLLKVQTLGDAEAIEFTAEVIQRMLRPEPSLLITRPQSLSRLGRERQNASTRVIAVTSGKGGVGKTSLSINLGVALAMNHESVAIIDSDLGLGNVDVLLDIKPKFNLQHLLSGERTVEEVLVEGPGGIKIIPGGNGLRELADLADWQIGEVIARLNPIEQYARTIFLDTGAGLGRNVTHFLLAADEVLLITTTEPHAITDAFAVAKVLSMERPEVQIHLVVNRAETENEGRAVADKFLFTGKRFLNLDISLLGIVPDDPSASRAIKNQKPLVLAYPNSKAALAIQQIARRLMGDQAPTKPSGGLRGFLEKARELFLE
ncbi:MAG TPA: P-loop NTPase [Bacillota bacterium]|jgi:flagellar biosynthesis protein FlhG|nr:P-loop NTPase [Bacillota bacterium]